MAIKRRQVELGFATVDHHYLCEYRVRDKGSEEMSTSLLRFKSGWPVEVEAWTACVTEEMSELVGDSVIIRAFGNNESTLADASTSMDYLANELTSATGGRYHPEWLVKNRVTRQIKTLPTRKRAQELKDAYVFVPVMRAKADSILILDDVCSSGSTLASIATAVHADNPDCRISFLTLALANPAQAGNSRHTLDGMGYQWEQGYSCMKLEEDEEWLREYSHLKRKILKDFQQEQ